MTNAMVIATTTIDVLRPALILVSTFMTECNQRLLKIRFALPKTAPSASRRSSVCWTCACAPRAISSLTAATRLRFIRRRKLNLALHIADNAVLGGLRPKLHDMHPKGAHSISKLRFARGIPGCTQQLVRNGRRNAHRYRQGKPEVEPISGQIRVYLLQGR